MKKRTKITAKLKIYIAGRITGDVENARQVFKRKEQELTERGYEVINPFSLPHKDGATWEDYMKVCIQYLMECDEIYMLQEWEYSKGASIERNLAEAVGIEVRYEVHDEGWVMLRDASPDYYQIIHFRDKSGHILKGWMIKQVVGDVKTESFSMTSKLAFVRALDGDIVETEDVVEWKA